MRNRSSPKAVTPPDAGRTKPESTLKNVVLPAPFGPMRPQTPSSNRRFMPSRDVTPPYLTLRSLTSIMPRRLPSLPSLPPGSARRPRGDRRGSAPQPADEPVQALHVLGKLVGDPAGRGREHLHNADAEQD